MIKTPDNERLTKRDYKDLWDSRQDLQRKFIALQFDKDENYRLGNEKVMLTWKLNEKDKQMDFLYREIDRLRKKCGEE